MDELPDRKALELAQNLFFIVGTGRCGTTLLQAMLSSHSQIAIPPETGLFSRYDPQVRFSDPLREEDIEAYLSSCTQDWWWHELGLNTDAFSEAVRSGMRDSRHILLWLLWQLSVGKVRVGDKTIGHGLLSARILDVFPEAKFIHIYRDPRDVVASLQNQCWWTAKSVIPTAMYCRKILKHLKLLAEQLEAEQMLSLQYETLVEQPERELRKVCAFLGEDFEPGMLKFYQRQDRGYVDVESEWKNLTTKPLTKARKGRYREQLAPKEIWAVERIVGSLLTEYGYEPDPEVPHRLGWLVTDAIDQMVWQLRCWFIGGPDKFADEKPLLKKRMALSQSKSA